MEKAFVKNAADIKQVKSAGQKVRTERERELKDMAFILSTEQGRRYIWRMLRITGVDKQTFEGDINWSVFNSGERNVGLRIKTDINEADPMSLITMMKEAKYKSDNEMEPESKKESQND